MALAKCRRLFYYIIQKEKGVVGLNLLNTLHFTFILQKQRVDFLLI